eukprot:5058199-Prymnesium_polylepis.1
MASVGPAPNTVCITCAISRVSMKPSPSKSKTANACAERRARRVEGRSAVQHCGKGRGWRA